MLLRKYLVCVTPPTIIRPHIGLSPLYGKNIALHQPKSIRSHCRKWGDGIAESKISKVKGFLQKQCGIEDTMCVLVTGVHTGVVDALGGLLLVVSDTTHLHLCDLQGVGGPLPVSPDYPLPTR